ncbi:ATPase [Halomonas sp. FeN2]|uniref:ATPase n=1 Tax=Halomonas sp. FeN2 TaxID=2832500 RepID=UPI000C4A2B6A|nr:MULTISPECIES: ATPase [unclassified Halomonas]MBF56881.1 ATPase [Halomonas sp.]MBF58869.1 ATPase [Halomonas sp.]UBR51832.1 ATPase [Halomonas sp. FeN2]|tara:strand:- start:308 stop:766 length:459 start_codon:yes stop_codon:yes gene_type:complete
MDVRTFGELIDWTRQLHKHLADCLAHCADQHQEERARMLLSYLATQESEMQRVVARFEQTADAKALKTYAYDYLEHKPIRTHRTCDAPYAKLSVDDICREVFDFHEQTINLYRTLVGKAEIPETKDLLESLLDLEEHEAMRLVRQTGRMNDV